MNRAVKDFLSYEDQVDLLERRGMDVGDHGSAVQTLRTVNYYRLSGYWYPFRKLGPAGRLDDFYPGTTLKDVVALYEFDARLRTVTFASLAEIELTLRALLGHELGRIDPCAHLEPSLLGPLARDPRRYGRWLAEYTEALRLSREDFVEHHDQKYGGRLPVWAAVELMGWGSLGHLFSFAPRPTQDTIARECGLSAPQLGSWFKALNIVRNTCAHHGRLYNRVHTITAKLPRPGEHPDLDSTTTEWSRTFAQLSLIQFLLDRLGVGNPRLIPAVMKSFPTVKAVPVTHMGAPLDWNSRSPLWAV